MSTELWECLNTTRARMPRRVASDKVHEFFAWVRERSALAVGIIESATSRDETWQFFTLGRSIERADMTARLLATRSLTEASGPSWTTILRSCSAYEAYLRTYRGVCRARATPPSSCCWTACSRAASSSPSVAPSSACATSSRAPSGSGSPTRRCGCSGRSAANWSTGRSPRSLEQLPLHMDNVQLATSAASEAIRRRYFPANAAPSWVGETG